MMVGSPWRTSRGSSETGIGMPGFVTERGRIEEGDEGELADDAGDSYVIFLENFVLRIADGCGDVHI